MKKIEKARERGERERRVPGVSQEKKLLKMYLTSGRVGPTRNMTQTQSNKLRTRPLAGWDRL